jgi:predicted nucleic acid-binding protein
MVTAVDTSVLLDVLLNDPQHAPRSIAALHRAATEGSLVICDAALAEIVPVLTAGDLSQFLADWKLTFLPSTQLSPGLPSACSVLLSLRICTACANSSTSGNLFNPCN